MNVWMKVCRQKTNCNYCPNPILKGEYMVVCKWFKRTKDKAGTPQTWSFFKRFHPQCWIDQAVVELEKRPIVETRGRKKLEVTDDTRIARFAILRRRASIIQRIRRETKKPSEEQSIDRLVHLGSMLNDLKVEIEPYGGVPDNWG